jgi:hypothetical protein
VCRSKPTFHKDLSTAVRELSGSFGAVRDVEKKTNSPGVQAETGIEKKTWCFITVGDPPGIEISGKPAPRLSPEPTSRNF